MFVTLNQVVSSKLIDEAISQLEDAKNPLILVGGDALEENNLIKLAKVADKITAVVETVEEPKEEVKVKAEDNVTEVKETETKPKPRRGRKKKED